MPVLAPHTRIWRGRKDGAREYESEASGETDYGVREGAAKGEERQGHER